MQTLTLDFIIESCQGKMIGYAQPNINQIIIDSRQEIDQNTLFIAIKGENHDGHDFVPEVFSRGASVAIVSSLDDLDINSYPDKVLILVEDTLSALQEIAKSYRQMFDIPILAITGSVGKTTTKDILFKCLNSGYKTLYTAGNYNNDIGLPLTIFRLEKSHEVAVLEVAMRGLGEISRLVNIARPTCAIITNAEPVHLENLGSLENIVRAKCEVLETLSAQDFAFINGDNKLLLEVAHTYPCQKYTFGYDDNCDCQVLNVSSDSNGILLKLKIFQDDVTLKFPIPTPKLAVNIAAAFGTAYLLGVPIPEIIKSIESYGPTSNRLQINHLPLGGIIINDTYNANPLSMQAALETAYNLKGNKRLVAVLGDMYELGDYEKKGHLQVGENVVTNQVDLLITIGSKAEFIREGAIKAGMNEANIFHFDNKSGALNFLEGNIEKTDVVLFKASRGLELEKLINNWLDN